MYELSFEHFERAAEGGHARAQYKLGRMYDYGLGVQQDRKKAFDYY
jgi:TPR repeat protein